MKTKQSLEKRLLSLLLCMCLICGILPLTGMIIAADTDTDVWDGSIATGFAGGTGSETDPYKIATGAQLAYLGERADGGEDFENTYFVLTADLNLNNRSWIPIGTGAAVKIFKGSFDGDGHIISNYSVLGKAGNDTYTRQGLFGTFQGEYIKNLNLLNVKFVDTANASTASYVGGLAGVVYVNTRVENCHAHNVKITVGTYGAGGLAGIITSDGANPTPAGGGLFGCTSQNISIEPDNTTTASGSYGGLVGTLSAIKDGDVYTLENCYASGRITENSDESWLGNDYGGIGGLAGAAIGGKYNSATGEVTEINTLLIRNCYADVTITAPNLGGVGGLFGEATALKMENCSAIGDVIGKWSTGGLTGAGAGSVFTGCYATGNVTANDWQAGGLIGYGPKSTLTGCFATGDVTVTQTEWASRVGGLMGNGHDSVVTDCYATGNVEGQMYIGGLVGWMSDNSDPTLKGTFTNCFSFGRLTERESDDSSYSVPFVYGSWDDGITIDNCYYSEEQSGTTEGARSDTVNMTPAQFADGTVLTLLGGAFVQIDGAACPTLPIEWDGLSSFESGFYYRISDGRTVRSDQEVEIDHLTIPADTVLEVRGLWEIGRNQIVTVNGQIPCGENGKVVMTSGKTLSSFLVYGTVGNIEALGGSTVFHNGCMIGKATVDLPFDDEWGAYAQLISYGTIGELYLKSGAFFNYNNGTIGKATIISGELDNFYLRYTGMEDLPNPPVIELVVLQGGLLYQDNQSDTAYEGNPYENPARVKKLTMDMTVPDGTVYNCHGAVIEEAELIGGNDIIDGPEDTATFDNYKGGVVEKLTVKGNAGYNIYNRNDTEYGAPVVKDVTTDGGYCRITNDNGGLIEKATVWDNSELCNNRRAVVENAYIHESNVRNTFNEASNTGGTIKSLYTTGWSSINNWAPANIETIYADRTENSQLYISGVDGENPNAPSGEIGKLYYRIEAASGTPGTFSMGDNTVTVSDAGDDFNGVYGLTDEQVGLAFNYTGSGKLTGIQMNGTELTAGADDGYSFTMPGQNAVLSTSDRTLRSDATLKDLSYSINGSVPVPVPEFAANGESYTVFLPRATPRDAAITLAGICADQNARITANTGGTLTYGATKQPVSITVTAEDGSSKTYRLSFFTEPTTADMKDAAIDGIKNGETFIQNETPAFTASGSGVENADPAVDDERYRPASWRIDDGSVLSGSFADTPFTGSLDLSRLSQGNHTLTVQYNWEQFGEIYENDVPTGEYGWIVFPPDMPEELIKTVSFTVDPVTYGLTVVNGTDETGGSPYEEGAVVSLAADAPIPGYVFDKWVLTFGSGTFADATKAETAFTMGPGDATVTASYKDVEAPTGEIIIADNHWISFLNTISFGLFYKEKQDVTIEAQDTGGEEVTVEYFLSVDVLSLENVKVKNEGWVVYDGKFGIDPDAEFIVYARLTDKAGNISYLSSNGVVLDATPPTVEGAQDGRTYDTTLKITVTDTYLRTVTVNGSAQTVENGRSEFVLTENGTYIILTDDEAGNETTLTVTVALPPSTYVLTFDADGGMPAPPVQILEAGGKPASVDDPEKEGYTFLGWYNGESKVDLDIFRMPTGDVTLTAKWEKQQSIPGQVPSTGDNSMPVYGLSTLLSGGIVILLILHRRKKQQID